MRREGGFVKQVVVRPHSGRFTWRGYARARLKSLKIRPAKTLSIMAGHAAAIVLIQPLFCAATRRLCEPYSCCIASERSMR